MFHFTLLLLDNKEIYQGLNSYTEWPEDLVETQVMQTTEPVGSFQVMKYLTMSHINFLPRLIFISNFLGFVYNNFRKTNDTACYQVYTQCGNSQLFKKFKR